MSALHKAGRALQIGLGLALLAALALVNGCASEESRGEATEAQVTHTSGRFACTQGEGRRPSTLEILENPTGSPFCDIVPYRAIDVSFHYCAGNPPSPTCPDCVDLGRSLGCNY